jgi:hypothetical protein
MVEEARPSIPSTGKKRLSRRGRQICLQVVVGMIILVCGVIIGSGAAVLRLKDEMVMRRGPFPPTRAVVDDMAARYDLTPEQIKQVEAAFEKSHEKLRTLIEESRRKNEAEFKTLSANIKKIFTPEQFERWEQDFKRRRRPGPPWERGPGRPGERGPGRRGPDGRGPGRGFGERGPGRGFDDRDRGVRDYGERGRDPRGPESEEPNAPSDQ